MYAVFVSPPAHKFGVTSAAVAVQRVVFVLAFGVFWEILEFATGVASFVGGEAVLAQYGVRDIALDLTFNAVGALFVATLGTDYLREVA